MLCRRQDEATDVSRARSSEGMVSGAGTRWTRKRGEIRLIHPGGWRDETSRVAIESPLI